MKIPESLRKQLSEAGKKGAATLTHEDRVKAGNAAWEKRLKKAQEKEATDATD